MSNEAMFVAEVLTRWMAASDRPSAGVAANLWRGGWVVLAPDGREWALNDFEALVASVRADVRACDPVASREAAAPAPAVGIVKRVQVALWGAGLDKEVADRLGEVIVAMVRADGVKGLDDAQR